MRTERLTCLLRIATPDAIRVCDQNLRTSPERVASFCQMIDDYVARGRDVAINVVHLYDDPPQWHVSVNNLTDKPVTTKLKQAMDLPRLDFEEREITLAPGEYRVLTAKARGGTD